MAALAPGEIALVHYVDDVPYHQCLILAWVTDTEYVVATPDFDLFIEQLDLTNPGLDGLRLPGARQAMGVGAGNVYTFAAIPDGAERAALLQEGARMSAMERVRRGLPPIPGGAGAGTCPSASHRWTWGASWALHPPVAGTGAAWTSGRPRRCCSSACGSGSSTSPCSSCSGWRVSAGGWDLGLGRADGQPRHRRRGRAPGWGGRDQ